MPYTGSRPFPDLPSGNLAAYELVLLRVASVSLLAVPVIVSIHPMHFPKVGDLIPLLSALALLELLPPTLEVFQPQI